VAVADVGLDAVLVDHLAHVVEDGVRFSQFGKIVDADAKGL